MLEETANIGNSDAVSRVLLGVSIPSGLKLQRERLSKFDDEGMAQAKFELVSLRTSNIALHSPYPHPPHLCIESLRRKKVSAVLESPSASVIVVQHERKPRYFSRIEVDGLVTRMLMTNGKTEVMFAHWQFRDEPTRGWMQGDGAE